jgi:hypothetical protein
MADWPVPGNGEEIFVIAFLTFLRLFQRGTLSDAFSSLLSSLVARLKAIMAQAGLVSPEPQVFVCGNSFGS